MPLDPEELTIRESRPGDGAGLAAIWIDGAPYYQTLFADDFQRPSEAGLAEWFESGLTRTSADHRSTVATRGDLIIGMAGGSLQPPFPSPERQWNPSLGALRLHIDYLVVLSAQWRKGVGQALVTDLERWARDRGATEAFTDTYHESPVSRSFWEARMGYRPRAVILRKHL
jgi:GNAT superfamily N-acetyltransferase